MKLRITIAEKCCPSSQRRYSSIVEVDTPAVLPYDYLDERHEYEIRIEPIEPAPGDDGA